MTPFDIFLAELKITDEKYNKTYNVKIGYEDDELYVRIYDLIDNFYFGTWVDRIYIFYDQYERYNDDKFSLEFLQQIVDTAKKVEKLGAFV